MMIFPDVFPAIIKTENEESNEMEKVQVVICPDVYPCENIKTENEGDNIRYIFFF